MGEVNSIGTSYKSLYLTSSKNSANASMCIKCGLEENVENKFGIWQTGYLDQKNAGRHDPLNLSTRIFAFYPKILTLLRHLQSHPPTSDHIVVVDKGS